MKAGLATSLSIVGVLATGGAALVLNSSILDTESSAKGSPAFATVVGLQSNVGVMPLGGGAAPRSATELSADGVADALSTSASATVTQPAGNGTPSAKTPTASDGQTGAIRQTQAAVAATQTTVPESPSPTAAPLAPTTTTAGSTSTSLPAAEKQFKVGDAATITLVVNGTKLLVKDIAITPGSGYEVTNQVSRDGDDVRITLSSPTRAIEFSARLVNGQIMAAVSAPSSGNLNPPRPPHRDDDDDHDDDHRDDDRRPRHGEDDEDDHHEDGHDDDDD